MNLEETVGQYIRERRMIVAGDHVLAAVSGGLDSMVMLELLAGLRSELGFRLAAAHYDHGLRGEQGREEGELVRGRCEELEVGFHGGSAGSTLLEAAARDNLQSAARRARYGFLEQAAALLGCNRIATAHHRDDQAETVLIRLLSGSGLSGLAAIPAVSLGGRLIRPLLGIPRARLEQYASRNSVPWRQDPSNLKTDYLRNSLRLGLIPAVERDYDPGFRDHLAGLAGEAAMLRDFLDERVEELLKGGEAVIGETEARVDCRCAVGLSTIEQRHLLRFLALRLSGGELILSDGPLEAARELMLAGRSGASLDLGVGLVAVREFDNLTIRRRRGVPFGPDEPLELVEGENIVRPGGEVWRIVVETRERAGSEGVANAGECDSAGWWCECFDPSSLELPLSAGSWREGERIEPYRLGGTKKLKKLFREKRVPLGRRRSIPVIRDACGRTVWVCGVARSSLAPLTGEEGEIMLLRARREGA